MSDQGFFEGWGCTAMLACQLLVCDSPAVSNTLAFMLCVPPRVPVCASACCCLTLQFKRCENLPTKKQLQATIARLLKQPATRIATGRHTRMRRLRPALVVTCGQPACQAGCDRYHRPCNTRGELAGQIGFAQGTYVLAMSTLLAMPAMCGKHVSGQMFYRDTAWLQC